MNAPVPHLRLLPSADVAELDGVYYLFDRAALDNPVVSVPTQRVSRRLFDVVRRLKTAVPFLEGRSYADLEALLDGPAARRALASLVTAGYLEPASGAPPAATAPAAPADSELEHFRQQGLKHYFRPASFFHLPAQIADEDCDVALVGVPFASTAISRGTVEAPARLRADSQRAGFWFDFHAEGVYTELACDDSEPRLLGAGIRLKDCGDIGADVRTVGDLFGTVSDLIEQRFLPHGVRPLFIGGDHAITFPIVDCYLRHYPELTVLHLDAHNDLFYTERVEYNHAGPIHALLAHSALTRVLSMGLRTFGDARVGAFKRRRSAGDLDGRVSLYALGALRRWLARPEAFRAHLDTLLDGAQPCYLTIDLDVLSPECVAGQLSTPAGDGLAWHELLELVRLLGESCNLLAADVVEFNPLHKNRATEDERELVVLLLELIDALGRQRRTVQVQGD